MSENPKEQQPTTAEHLQGRSVFAIETVPAGVSVRTVFLTQDEKLLEMPAVFPNLQYALLQVEELKQHIIKHFEEAAKVGVQVIATQQAGSADAEPAAMTTATASAGDAEASAVTNYSTSKPKTAPKPRTRRN